MPIIRANEPIAVNQISIVIYGEPGSGKTSTACTAKNALILDFDKGAHRSAFRCDVLQMSDWNEIQRTFYQSGDNEEERKLHWERIKNEFAEYDTIVIDTLGRCIDYIIQYIGDLSPKFVKNGNPTILGWGELKFIFAKFIKQLQFLGKDVVMVAHEREKEDGDTTKVRPDVSGSSYAEIFKVADFVGRQYMTGSNRTLNFSPDDRRVGKNSANFPVLKIPDFAVEPAFFAGVIATMKTALGAVTKTQQAAIDQVGEYRAKIFACETAEHLNYYLAELRTKNLTKIIMLQIKALADARAAQMQGVTWDKKITKYIVSPPPTPPADNQNHAASSFKAEALPW
jgi:phage nucleotide-binding protein